MTKFLKDAGFRAVIFYDEPHKSLSSVLAREVIDEGITHSLIVEAVK
jgi:hypothetical protein